jgi:hypothetical protein
MQPLQGQAEGRLTAEEVCAQCSLLLGAGHITTMDQLGNTVLALLNNPGQWRRLRDDPALVRPAVEEGLRYDGTAQLLQRIARADRTARIAPRISEAAFVSGESLGLGPFFFRKKPGQVLADKREHLIPGNSFPV